MASLSTLSGTPVEKVKNGGKRWIQRYWIPSDDPDEKPRRGEASDKSKEVAVAKAEQAVGEINDIILKRISKDRYTIEQFAEKFCRDTSAGRAGRRPAQYSTVKWYRDMFAAYIVPRIGEHILQEFSGADAERYHQSLLDDIKTETITNFVGRRSFKVYKSLMAYAVYLKLIPASPGYSLTIWGEEQEDALRKIRQVPSEKLIEKLDATAREHYMSNDKKISLAWARYYPLYMILRTTGCRSSEALGLQWGDFSEDFMSATLARKKMRVSDPSNPDVETAKLKTTNSVRKIYFGKETAAALRKWKKLNEGNPNYATWVFASKSGKILTYENFRDKGWTPMVQRANVPNMSLHKLRHYFASILIKDRKQLAASRLLGHATVAFTEDQYGHLIDDDGQEMREIVAMMEPK